MKVQELKEKIDAQEHLELLDVREREEIEEGGSGVPGAKNMPMGQVFVEAAKGRLPKDQKIVTICAKGGRCEIVARELKKEGYDIEYLEGGLEEWHKNS